MRLLILAALFGGCSLAQTVIDVGSGSPDSAVMLAFIAAWNRNGFSALVGDPLGKVSKYGSTGLAQLFPSVSNSANTLALIKPDTTDTSNVQQVLASMYAYYSTVGVSTAGYPTGDTLKCPALHASTNSCQWQTFSTDYALFVYASPLPSNGPQNVATRDPYYTRWTALGGISVLGPPNSAETTLTSSLGSQATFQTFDQGAIYSLTSGLYSGRVLSVKEPVYDLYVANGGLTGPLGAPVTAELALSNGMIQQSFEGGAIQYDPKTGIAVLRPPVNRITLAPTPSIHLNVGGMVTAQVTLYAADGSLLTDRVVAWNTSNGRVVQIQSNGLSATLTATGAGTATVTATSEGRTSSPLTVSVTAPCCQIGEGAPTASIQQAFQDAVRRNRLSVQVPAASAAQRVGNGYVQQLLSTDAMPVPYLIAVPDGSVTGYLVAGALLSQYLALGGPTGSLGYPLSDATAGGRQTFQQGTLAGNPVRLVTGAILARWGVLGYETGAAGSPTAGSTAFLTFRGTTGASQTFQRGIIFASATGPLSGQSYFVSGAVLAKYLAAGGAGGDCGAPTDDEHAAGNLRQQDFEGGFINYAPGAAANLVLQPRQPLITATPATVFSGTSVHLVVGGFNNGATVSVSQTGQPDFVVTVANGAYAWDVRVPATAPGGVVTVRATDQDSGASAQGSYTVRSASAAVLTVSISSGDRQTGAPGAALPQPLTVIVRDQNGVPVPAQAVSFAASPGAQVSPASAVTGADGSASAVLRMPMAEAVVLATAQAGSSVTTFSAKSAAVSLTNFPQLTQSLDDTLGNSAATIRQKGALLTSAASILRYYQLLNQLPQPNGLADPAALNKFLKTLCVTDSQGHATCDGFVSLGQSTEQTVNLWRVGGFTGSLLDVRIEQTSLNAVRDLVAAGSPVLLALALASGSHFVVADGIAADGSILIADPLSAQANLNGYLAQGKLAGALRLLPQAPASPGFLVIANAPIAIASVSGACGQTLSFPDTASAAGTASAGSPGTLFFHQCDGSSGLYQLDIAAAGPFNATLTDLSQSGVQAVWSGSGASSSEVIRSGSQWTLAPLALSLAAGGVVNAASFTASIAPGGLISIYGVGLAGAAVQIGGQNAPVLIAAPFQINAQIPDSVPPGAATLSVSSKNGSAQQSVAIDAVAPAIFSVGLNQAAITNQDNSLNTPANPASRGSAIVIYGTGFGAVSPSGPLNVAAVAVSAVIAGIQIPAAFAGLTPGFIGLYQANIVVPAGLPPGLSLPLYLQQGGASSNTVTVAIQ